MHLINLTGSALKARADREIDLINSAAYNCHCHPPYEARFMTIVGMIFGGVVSGLVFAAIPTILIVYLVAKLGSIFNKRRGFLVAGYIAAAFCCIPFIYFAGFYLREITTTGLKYPQYGDQFLGFSLLGFSLVCAVAALSTVKLSERVARFRATRRNDERPA